MKRVLAALPMSACLMWCIWTDNASAQTPPSVCNTLAAGLQQDVLVQGSDAQVFKKYQSLISDDRYRNFTTASAAQLDTSVSIPEYVDATLGTRSTAQTWETNWSRFRSIQESEFMASSRARTEARTTNERVIKDIVGCVENENTLGLHSAFDVAPDRSSFTIRMRYRSDGNGSWSIKEILADPRDAVTGCNQVADFQRKFPMEVQTAKFLVQCSKTPDRAVRISINTSEGTVGPFDVRGTHSDVEDLRQQLDDQARTFVAVLGEQRDHAKVRMDQLENQIKALMEKSPFGSRANCNDHFEVEWDGWQLCPTGQYVAGARRWKAEQQLTFIRCCPAS